MKVVDALIAAGADPVAVENPDWANDRWTWMEFVSQETRYIWSDLSTEAKLSVYLTAKDALSRFPG